MIESIKNFGSTFENLLLQYYIILCTQNKSIISMANPVLWQKFYKSTDPGTAEQIFQEIR